MVPFLLWEWIISHQWIADMLKATEMQKNKARIAEWKRKKEMLEAVEVEAETKYFGIGK